MFEFDEEFMQMDAEYRQLKSDLESSASSIGDWKIAKIYEYRMAGLEDPYDFDELHQARQEARDRINELEVLLEQKRQQQYQNIE